MTGRLGSRRIAPIRLRGWKSRHSPTSFSPAHPNRGNSGLVRGRWTGMLSKILMALSSPVCMVRMHIDRRRSSFPICSGTVGYMAIWRLKPSVRQ